MEKKMEATTKGLGLENGKENEHYILGVRSRGWKRKWSLLKFRIKLEKKMEDEIETRCMSMLCRFSGGYYPNKYTENLNELTLNPKPKPCVPFTGF